VDVPESPLNKSALRLHVDGLIRENIRKDNELARVRAIADAEKQQATTLKDKAEDLKNALVSELEGADRALESRLKEIRNKQEAIQKVSARAVRERSRSCVLLDEIKKLTTALAQESKDDSFREFKKSEYGPDTAYLAEFSELIELDNQTPMVVEIQPISDPAKLVHSPPLKAIQLSFDGGSTSTECIIFTQKMRDLECLEKEKAKKDEELVRLKRLAEAERCRFLLLKDKAQELKNELRSIRNRSG